jgi:hypothetical protein
MESAHAVHYEAAKERADGYRKAASEVIARWRGDVVAFLAARNQHSRDASSHVDTTSGADTGDVHPKGVGQVSGGGGTDSSVAEVASSGETSADPSVVTVRGDVDVGISEPLQKPRVGDYAALERWADRSLNEFCASLEATLDRRVAALEGALFHEWPSACARTHHTSHTHHTHTRTHTHTHTHTHTLSSLIIF